MLHFFVRLFSFIVSLCHLAIIVSFVLSNREPIDLYLFPIPYNITSPVYIIALLCIIVGWVAGYTLAIRGKNKIKIAHKREIQRSRLLQDEIKALRLEKHAPSPTDSLLPSSR